MTHARYRWKRVYAKDYQYRRCPFCNSRMVIIHYNQPTHMKRYNGVRWPADCQCGKTWMSAKDDRGHWVIIDTWDLPANQDQQ